MSPVSVVVAIAVAIKATAGVALPFLVWIWMIHERERAAAAESRTAAVIRSGSFAKTAGLGVVGIRGGVRRRLGRSPESASAG